MAETGEVNLWSEFNLAENNPDPGGGILYAIRYDTDGLLEHRTVVTQAITNVGATIAAVGGLLGVDLSAVSEHERDRTHLLLEELSVVNEAIEYHTVGINPDSIDSLASGLKDSFLDGLMFGDTDEKVAAFNLVDLGIPQIVRDLKIAQEQNNVLTPTDYQTIKALGDFASRKVQSDMVATE